MHHGSQQGLAGFAQFSRPVATWAGDRVGTWFSARTTADTAAFIPGDLYFLFSAKHGFFKGHPHVDADIRTFPGRVSAAPSSSPKAAKSAKTEQAFKQI